MRRDLALIVTCLAMFCTVRADEEEEEDEDYELELGAWDGWEEVTLEGRQGRESVVITLGELQDLFGITEERKEKEKLKGGEKKAARRCRRQGRLLLRSSGKCHQPTGTEVCPAGRWFVAVQGRLDGVCSSLPCSDPGRPVLYEGTCSPVYGTCNATASRLYINKRGVGFCECEEGFSYNLEDKQCHREHTRGPCSTRETWLTRKKKNVPKNRRSGHKRFGKCRRTKCSTGEVKWEGGLCLQVEADPRCVESITGQLHVEGNRLTCREAETSDSGSGRDIKELFLN